MVSPSVKRGVLVIVILVFAQLAFAQQVNFHQTSSGSCAQASQCLVSNAFNPFLDNNPSAFWDGLVEPAQGPKCIGNSQFILDRYCDNSFWASRTKLVALRLLSFNNNQPFTLHCGPPGKVLPQFTELQCSFSSFNSRQIVEPCTNSVCIFKSGNFAALGFSLNSANGPQNALTAFNISPSLCDSVLDNNNQYDFCGANFWYDHQTLSLIYAPGVSNIPAPAGREIVELPFNKLKTFASTGQRNFSFFNNPEFSELLISSNNPRFMFAFRQSNVTLLNVEYIGLYLSNIRADVCPRFTRFDPRVSCQSSSSELFLVASKQLGSDQGMVDSFHKLGVVI